MMKLRLSILTVLVIWAIQQLMMQLGGTGSEPSILSDTPFEALGPAVSALKAQEPGVVYARLPYAIEMR